MATLYLHIGQAKTGTSYIQACFRANRSSLAKYGVRYAVGEDSPVKELVKITSGNGTDLLMSAASLDASLSMNNISGKGSLLYSSENIFRHFLDSHGEEYLEDIAAKHGFEKIEILVFIRNPIGMEVSSLQQLTKRAGNFTLTVANLYERTQDGRNPVFFVEHFLSRIKKCKNVAVTIRNYSYCSHRLMEEVAEWLGVPSETFAQLPVSKVNRPLTWSELNFQRALNKKLGKSGKIFSDPLCEKLPDMKPEKILPPLEVQEKIWSMVSETVGRLNKEIPEQHRYQCDIQDSAPLPDVFTFNQQQIDVITEGLGNEILKLRDQLKDANETISQMKAEQSSIKANLRMIIQSIREIPQHLKINQQIKIIKNSEYFDEHFYLGNNPDVKASGMNPMKHFLLFGGNERRNPSAHFDAEYYLMQNPDVVQSRMNPLVHYLKFGKAEGRPIQPVFTAINPVKGFFSNPLEEYFFQNRRNTIHKWTHYFEIYHKHFERFRGKKCVILEIGVSLGGSLQMWKHYFGEKASIIGIDINPECKKFEEDQIEIFIGSQSDREFLRDLKTKIPEIDILIDDGGHTMEQQITTFEELYNHVSTNGIYLTEDTFTAYLPNYGGGFRKSGTFMEFAKNLIDELHGYSIFGRDDLVTDFTNTAGSIHFYNGIVVIEKALYMPALALQTGKESECLVRKISQTDLDIFNFKLKILGVKNPSGFDANMLFYDESMIESLLQEKYEGRNWPINADTMIGYKRLSNIEFCVQEIIRQNVPGDLIETGVWRGGACIFMRALLKMYGVTDKRVWVADSFEGLPKPDPAIYPADINDKHHEYDELRVSLKEVKTNFQKYDLLDDQVVFLKGWFKDTLPAAPVEKLSLLRLDGDMYESTIDALFYLYPKLSTGGFCIIDDWGAIQACKKAVNDYRSIFNIGERIQMIDWTGIFWKKEKQIPMMSRKDFLLKIKEKNYEKP